MPRPTRRSPAHGRLAGALLAACLLAACSSNDTTDPPRTTTTTHPPRTTTSSPTTTTTTPPPTPEAAVRTAYLAAVEALNAAYETSDPTFPGLAETRTGEDLATVRRMLQDRRQKGLRLRYQSHGAPRPTITRVALTKGSATVVACVLDDAVLVESRTGRVIDDSKVMLVQTARLVATDQRWKVSFVVSEPATPEECK